MCKTKRITLPTIKYRVVRLWSLPPYPKNSPHDAIEMVLCDCEGSKISAYIKSTFAQKYSNIIKEGSVYVMSQFNVGSNDGAFRAVNHKYKLNFQFSTRVAETDDDGFIPRYGFNFLDGERILNGNLDQQILVGCLHVIFIVNNNMQQVIIALQYFKLKEYNGSVTLSNSMYASRMVINVDIEEIMQFRDAAFDGWAWALSSLNDLNFAGDGNVLCLLASVQKVNAERGWFYDSCKSFVKPGWFYQDAKKNGVVTSLNPSEIVDLTSHHDVVATPSKVQRLSPVDIDGRRLSFADSEHTPSSSASGTGKRTSTEPNSEGPS
ncbi:replication protein A 70 kDa DNA-binding subunit C-like [Senna tora]|uniref:Replication protein A 70 kDa DNA-binding subunit C-like n=1 Tax=Senna tora TaxID=362788 RepID=A0A834T4T0_9FABA|nr:replication protein A 70 kDa DNA-binding subunit C-like [Senna tora]